MSRLQLSFRLAAVAGALTVILVAGVTPAHAGPRHGPPSRGGPPAVIALPNGFHPEGITRDGQSLYSGSLVDGDIYRASAVTGEGARLVDAPPGRTAIGLHVDHHHRLFVAGGPLGAAYVYDSRTGAAIADYHLGEAGTSFVNDAVITRGAVWFTDSFRPVLYKLPLGRGGALPPSGSDAEVLAITGPAAESAGQFNLNGIVAAPDGGLVVVNSSSGALFKISPATGASVRIDLGGATLVNGDGLVLDGRDLWVVQNEQDLLTLVTLDHRFTSGTVVGSTTDPALRFPTTAVGSGPWLYAVNARFDEFPPPLGGGAPDPDAEFEIVRVRASVGPT